MMATRQSPSGSPRQDCALAVWVGRCRSFGLLLFIHASILMMVITALYWQPSIRYLQPLFILAFLSIAIRLDRVVRRGVGPVVNECPSLVLTKHTRDACHRFCRLRSNGLSARILPSGTK